MLSTDEYLAIIEEALKTMEYPTEPESLFAPVKYTLECGGKRLRPILVLAACDACGSNARIALSQALGIEMFHNFTLLHDDVMDKADMRRGRPTVHVKWDERAAILSGDAMLTMAGQLIRRNCRSECLETLSDIFDRTAMEVYAGQQYDIDFESRNDVHVEEYIEMIRLKTSVLLGCACALGAIVAGAPDNTCHALYRYGEKLGMAFQLQDDYLDTYGDPMIFGKEIGGDILNDKKTWLLITAMAEDESGVLAQEIACPSENADKIKRVRNVYDDLGLPERCRALISGFADEAVAELRKAGLSETAFEFFARLTDKLRTRNH